MMTGTALPSDCVLSFVCGAFALLCVAGVWIYVSLLLEIRHNTRDLVVENRVMDRVYKLLDKKRDK